MRPPPHQTGPHGRVVMRVSCYRPRRARLRSSRTMSLFAQMSRTRAGNLQSRPLLSARRRRLHASGGCAHSARRRTLRPRAAVNFVCTAARRPAQRPQRQAACSAYRGERMPAVIAAASPPGPQRGSQGSVAYGPERLRPCSLARLSLSAAHLHQAGQRIV